MKKHLLFIVTALTLLWSTSSHAVGELGASGGANDNPHNLSSASTRAGNKAVSEKQICIFCHTPHGASPKSTLWGRPNPTGMGSFPTLTSISLGIDDPVAGGFNTTHYGDNTSGYEYPNGASKLCLSCHDGVTAMGVISSGPPIDMTGTGLLSGTLKIDLSKSHPISFIYTAAVVTYLVGSYKLPTAGYLDGDFRVQCTSCHQPHQDTRGTGANLPFWRVGSGTIPDDYDTVCRECHTSTPAFPTIPNSHNY